MMPYFVLVLLWIIWCAVHSLLISDKITSFLKKQLGYRYKYYRLLYNTISIITIIPVIYYSRSVRYEPVFKWDSYMIIFRVIIIFVAFLLFYLGAKQYSFSKFIGIYQVKTGHTGGKLITDKELNISGILKYIRHPWYTGALFIIWARDIYLSVILENLVITIYIIIGTYLEEQKLVYEFGESYKKYRKQVSMFITLKWLKKNNG